MNDKITIETQTKLLRLKSVLNKVNDASYGYHELSKRFPYTDIKTETEAKDLIIAYSQIIKDVTSSIQTLNHENSHPTHQNLE